MNKKYVLLLMLALEVLDALLGDRSSSREDVIKKKYVLLLLLALVLILGVVGIAYAGTEYHLMR